MPSDEPFRLSCDTLEQTLTRLGLQQYLDTLQAENLDLESLVIHTQTHPMDLQIQVYCIFKNLSIPSFRLFAKTVISKI